MNWYKLTDTPNFDCIEEWHSDSAIIVPGLPPIWAQAAVLTPDEESDGLYWLNTMIHADADEDVTLESVVEGNTGTSYTRDDPLWLMRYGRRVLSYWLENPPEWLKNWYRREWEEVTAP